VDVEVLVENVLNALTAGVTIGCIYGLMCIGLGLIFGIMRIVNFAQGELLMLGMYASLYLVTGGACWPSSDRMPARSLALSAPGRSSSPAAHCCTGS